MKEYPLLFNDEMVRAVLDGRKTQTRRAVKLQLKTPAVIRSPFGGPGDRLWVRECFTESEPLFYRATTPDLECKWKPSIHMPRWASRITLEVTDVRAEQIQDITEADAVAEGFERREHFIQAWDAIYASKQFGWDDNPWAWVGTFRKMDR